VLGEVDYEARHLVDASVVFVDGGHYGGSFFFTGLEMVEDLHDPSQGVYTQFEHSTASEVKVEYPVGIFPVELAVRLVSIEGVIGCFG
jgi:hypothetical protein